MPHWYTNPSKKSSLTCLKALEWLHLFSILPMFCFQTCFGSCIFMRIMMTWTNIGLEQSRTKGHITTGLQSDCIFRRRKEMPMHPFVGHVMTYMSDICGWCGVLWAPCFATSVAGCFRLCIATCTEILVWRTPQFDRKVWPLTVAWTDLHSLCIVWRCGTCLRLLHMCVQLVSKQSAAERGSRWDGCSNSSSHGALYGLYASNWREQTRTNLLGCDWFWYVLILITLHQS